MILRIPLNYRHIFTNRIPSNHNMRLGTLSLSDFSTICVALPLSKATTRDAIRTGATFGTIFQVQVFSGASGTKTNSASSHAGSSAGALKQVVSTQSVNQTGCSGAGATQGLDRK
jgi:hypothetical protein